MHIIDDNLQLRTDWEIHTGPDISGIPNPPIPTITRTRLMASSGREFYVAGPGGTDVLFAVHRPLPVNNGQFHLSFLMMTDFGALTGCRCLEFDSIVTLDKLKYNMSSQFNFNSGQFQISNGSGQWVDAGLPVNRFVPYQWYRLRYDYWFDSTAKRYSILSVTVDDVRHPVQSQFQNLSPLVTDWADVVSMQIQLDIDTQGGSGSVVVEEMKYTWDLP